MREITPVELSPQTHTHTSPPELALRRDVSSTPHLAPVVMTRAVRTADATVAAGVSRAAVTTPAAATCRGEIDRVREGKQTG